MITDDHVVEMYRSGQTGVEIADHLDWPLSRVYNTLDRCGVKRRPKGPRPGQGQDPAQRAQRERLLKRRAAVRASARKALAHRNQAMDDMRAAGSSLNEIAAHFGVTKQRVFQILGTGS